MHGDDVANATAHLYERVKHVRGGLKAWRSEGQPLTIRATVTGPGPVATGTVQFGIDGYTLHVVDTKQATDHKMHVVGMHPETAYKLKAVSTSATATGSAEGTFTTGKLPANAPATRATRCRSSSTSGPTS